MYKRDSGDTLLANFLGKRKIKYCHNALCTVCVSCRWKLQNGRQRNIGTNISSRAVVCVTIHICNWLSLAWTFTNSYISVNVPNTVDEAIDNLCSNLLIITLTWARRTRTRLLHYNSAIIIRYLRMVKLSRRSTLRFDQGGMIKSTGGFCVRWKWYCKLKLLDCDT